MLPVDLIGLPERKARVNAIEAARGPPGRHARSQVEDWMIGKQEASARRVIREPAFIQPNQGRERSVSVFYRADGWREKVGAPRGIFSNLTKRESAHLSALGSITIGGARVLDEPASGWENSFVWRQAHQGPLEASSECGRAQWRRTNELVEQVYWVSYWSVGRHWLAECLKHIKQALPLLVKVGRFASAVGRAESSRRS